MTWPGLAGHPRQFEPPRLCLPGCAAKLMLGPASGLLLLHLRPGRSPAAPSARLTGRDFGFVDSGGTITTINIPNSQATSVVGITPSGEVFGNYAPGSNQAGSHGFTYQDGTVTLIDPPGAVYAWISGIDSAGDIFGYYQDSSGSAFHGFIETVQGNNPQFTTIDMAPLIETASGWLDRTKIGAAESPEPTATLWLMRARTDKSRANGGPAAPEHDMSPAMPHWMQCARSRGIRAH
jgi:hypothetical protein